MKFSDFLTFEKLISPVVVKILYWVGIVGIILMGLVGLFSAFSAYGGGVIQFFTALIGTVAGLLFWRVVCEIYIVAFGIYDRLGDIRNTLAGHSGGQQPL